MSRSRIVSLAVALALVAELLAALVPLPRWIAHWGRLRRLPFVDRGALAAAETENFLARAGQVELRRELARQAAGAPLPPSAAGEAWRYFAAANPPPPTARIFLDLPVTVLYYQATFFWYPARVEVTPGAGVPLTDEVALARAALRLPQPPEPELVRLGYTHWLAARGPRLELRALAAPPARDAHPRR